MKAVIFDGREFAKNKEELLKLKVSDLLAKGAAPKLDSIIVGSDPASLLYVNLKKKAAERIGAEVNIRKYDETISKAELIEEIRKLSRHSSVTGIMVQLPLPVKFSKEDRSEILNSIAPEKDIDGLRSDSNFMAPTTKAVLEVLQEALDIVRLNKTDNMNILVVGSSGHEGKKIMNALNAKYAGENVQMAGADSKTKDLGSVVKRSDVVIAVTGTADLVKADMVKDGAILIDVGSPKGDIEKSAYEKAAFVSPVPGGIGPVTISCLLENLIN